MWLEVVCCDGFKFGWQRPKNQGRPRNGASSKYPLLVALPLLGTAVPLVETHYGEGDCLAVKHEHRHGLQEIGSGER